MPATADCSKNTLVTIIVSSRSSVLLLVRPENKACSSSLTRNLKIKPLEVKDAVQ